MGGAPGDMSFEAIIAQLHALPGSDKGRQFERLVKWYLENAPQYRPLVKRVYLWDEWPRRWGRDAGIDLVAETNRGDNWAIQAKAYAPGYWIKKRDVDSFLSESSRRAFSFRVLVGTTDHLGENAARTIHDQEKPAGLQLLSDLRHADVQWPARLDDLKPHQPIRLEPRSHQTEAITAVVGGMKATDRGQLLMACGTGKTLTALWIDESLCASRTLVIVPSLSLLGQTLRAWTAQSEHPFEYLAVCSDQTVVSEDNFISWTSDLGIPVTTDPAAVAAFLSQSATKRVVFSTYQSIPVIAAAQDAGRSPLDLVIADEAHRVAGRSDSAFGAVLDDDCIRAHKRLFMTATPRIVSRRVRAAALERDVAITSMDDETQFGPVLHRLSFSEAIERDMLSDYRIVVIGVDDPGVGRALDRRDLVAVNGQAIDAETLGREVGLLRTADSFGLKRILTFHSRKATARAFANGLPEVVDWVPERVRPAGRLWARHITGDMSAGEREVILDQLRALGGADWGVLANVRCVAEGVDVPTLDGIAFIDPRRSQVDVVQAVGRAIRKSPHKKLGIVVIPVFIPPAARDEDVLNASDFRTVWAVVRALRAHDDVLAEQLDTARFQLGRRRGLTELPDKIILDLPRDVDPRFAEALSARIVQRSTLSFEFYLGLLTRYADEHGTVADIAYGDDVDGHAMGHWITYQRQRNAHGVIGSDEKARLDALPGWTWEFRNQTKWDFWFGLLCRYVKDHGTVATLTNTTMVDGYALGEWASGQRRARTIGWLAPERAARLEALDGWFWHRHDTNWDRMFRLLVKYVEREGNAAVPDTHYEDGEWLGRWVTNQRMKYRGHRSERISEERVARLKALPGWSWDRRSAKWERALGVLQQFVDREGHATVPMDYMEGEFPLGIWVSRQRYAHRRGQLTRDRAARLNELPEWEWERPKGGAAKITLRSRAE